MRRGIILLSIIFILCLSGCGTKETEEKELNIVCAMFPEFDWTRNVIGDVEGIKIDYLINSGTDPHSFQPSVKDVSKICKADLFIFGGGESEAWIEEALNMESVNPDIKIINLMEVLEDRAYIEEAVEGMEDSKEEEDEYDEHLWLSLKNAIISTDAIASAIEKMSEKNREVLEKNASDYIEKLENLDNEYEKTIGKALKDTLLFADRFPFRYLVEDYNINYYAAFSGCSSDVDANLNTIVFLSAKMDELNLNTVLVLENSNGKIANSILKNTQNGGKVLVLDSMQSVTMEDIKKGTTYIEIMEKNLSVLNLSLNY